MSAGRALLGGAVVAILVVPLLLAGCGGGSETERRKEEIQVENALREAHLKALLKVKLAERKRRDAADLAAAGPVDPAIHRAALQRIAELERENEFLGKVSAFFASKPQR